VHWCDGSQQEYDRLCQELVGIGTFTKLNPITRPGCFLARTDPRDTFRPDSAAFVCCKVKEDAGPSNSWVAPEEMRSKLTQLFSGCMEGRTMYVVPFSMGPIGSPYSRIGIEITDSAYTVVNMRIVTRMGCAEATQGYCPLRGVCAFRWCALEARYGRRAVALQSQSVGGRSLH